MSVSATLWTSISKIFGENLAETATGYSKRFEASATDFAHRYRSDPFFRTEINILGLQFAFAALLLIIVAVTAASLYQDTSVVISRAISEVLTSGSPSSVSTSVAEELGAMRTRTVSFAAVAIVGVTLVLSYLIARVALAPTRSALESQKQFIGNVAHEIRTPLSIIKTNAEVRLLDPSVPKEARILHQSTIEELDRISEIINNLLSLSASIRPERMEFKDIDLGNTVRTVMGKLESLSDSKHIEVTARVSERRIVWGNITALEQVVVNILKNAITYSPRGGRIVVTVEPVYPDHIEFSVQDFGIGIASKDLFRIFEPYYRADTSRKREGRQSGGSGLGLTIVSELVKLHGGRITVRSSEGRGTIVTVLLPAGRTSLDRTGIAEGKREDASEVIVDFSHSNKST